MVPTLWVGAPVTPSSRAAKAPATSSSNAAIDRAAAPIALAPRCGLELCAAVPRTSTTARTMPLCARMTRSPVGSATTAATIRVPHAGSASARAAAPRMRYSSSTTPAYITLIGGGWPERAMRSMACSIATPPALVSLDPRPNTLPSFTTGRNGSIVMPSAVAVSMWHSNRTARPGSRPGSVATTLGRPGSASHRSHAIPASAKNRVR